MTIAPETPALADLAPLLACARQGDAEAFCQVAAAHETRLYQQAVGLCGNPHTAEDLAPETMVEAWRSVGRFNGACRFSTWLYAILLHRFQKLVRRNRVRPNFLASLPGFTAEDQAALLENVPDPQPTAADRLLQRELATRLHEALVELPENHQAVILLRFYEGASLLETAAALGLPLGTVKSRFHHALARLRQMSTVMNLFNPGGDT